jgi:hypothetical protein
MIGEAPWAVYVKCLDRQDRADRDRLRDALL